MEALDQEKNALFKLTAINKILMYVFLINKHKNMDLKHCYISKFSLNIQDRQDFHKNIDECTPAKRRKILIVFDAMVANMTINK